MKSFFLVEYPSLSRRISDKDLLLTTGERIPVFFFEKEIKPLRNHILVLRRHCYLHDFYY
ncbi:hypothetical protein DVK01_19505 [Haloarcula sp. Atlit-120R]|nr:hypothetical protein DVK01_19505 [Haloarcula sp. Atlit-120R]